ncbi:MAG: YheC/YheD family protein [Alicyclobacillus sp.]|nr:YheC/YheD family protein [Alicyclobacillus sp.]
MAPDEVLVSSGLAERLLPAAAWPHLRVRWVHGELRFGPLIGVLCNPQWHAKHKRLWLGKQLPALVKLVQAGQREGVLVYVFGLDGVDFAAECVHGYLWTERGWLPARLPLPDAIYDQVVSRKLERSRTYSERRQRLSRLYEQRLFNDGFLDKWQVYEWLHRDPRLRRHLPETVRFVQRQAAVAFLRRHAVTFLKPLHGSLGLGIVRVSHEADGGWRYELQTKRGRVEHRAGSAEAVLDALLPRLRRRPHVLQAGIAVARYQERPFDVRVVLQRDGTGVWRRTKVFARVASPGDFTANLARGGEAFPLAVVLREACEQPALRRSARNRVLRLAQLAAEALEQQSGKSYGELGVDLALDEAGRVWILEVNAKPWKAPDTERGRKDLVDLAFTRPVQYAAFLALQS